MRSSSACAFTITLRATSYGELPTWLRSCGREEAPRPAKRRDPVAKRLRRLPLSAELQVDIAVSPVLRCCCGDLLNEALRRAASSAVGPWPPISAKDAVVAHSGGQRSIRVVDAEWEAASTHGVANKSWPCRSWVSRVYVPRDLRLPEELVSKHIKHCAAHAR